VRIGIVAAEPSGDQLAAGLMAELLQQYPNTSFEGIGGPLMQDIGMDSWFEMEKLSVMGIFEVLSHLPELLRIRADLLKKWLASPPDIFIGVDAPDFNLVIESKLREQGVKTVHYVCPTVWAWREKRVFKIKKAADLILSIFPFEKKYLKQFDIEAEYVGHMMANSMPIDIDKASARKQLGINEEAPTLAVLPGSRISEVSKLLEPFMATAANCQKEINDLNIIMPLVTDKTRSFCENTIQKNFPELNVQFFSQKSREVLEAADVVLVASGTATFEALLCKKPMVVGYRINALTYTLFKLTKMLKIKYFAMANILSDENLAPEFIQHNCTSEKLTPAVMSFFNDEKKVQHIKQEYKKIHKNLIVDTNKIAATAVLELLK